MSVDFPRAWELTKEVAEEKHHPKCSYRVLGLLCDCEVLRSHPEYTDDILQGVGGEPCNLEAA